MIVDLCNKILNLEKKEGKKLFAQVLISKGVPKFRQEVIFSLIKNPGLQKLKIKYSV